MAAVRISVVIPALNEAECIGQTLNRLQAMRGRGHELVVVDGGSDDNTLAISKTLADRVIRSPRGRALQMRAGAAASSGSVIWFLHADTVPVDDADLFIQKALEQPGSRWGHFDVRLSGRRPILRLVSLLMNVRARITRVATGDQGIFMTRRLYGQVGGVPVMPLMEDIALSRKLNQHGRPAVIREKLSSSARRWETNGVVRTILLMWGLRFAYFIGVNPVRLAKYYAVNKV